MTVRDRPRALLVDYGGVLTTPLADTLAAWCAADGIDPAELATAMREWLGSGGTGQQPDNPVHALERGELAVPEFEHALAGRLSLPGRPPVPADGLLTRMFEGFAASPSMLGALQAARRQGILTGLLSNSWGVDYPRAGWDELFDDVVISGEVGLRKPEPEIYLLAAERLGVEPARCVFVDDLAPNVRAAATVGMVGVHHTDPATTVAELEACFGVALGGGADRG